MEQTPKPEVVRLILQPSQQEQTTSVVLKSDRFAPKTAHLDTTTLRAIRQSAEELEDKILQTIKAHDPRDSKGSLEAIRADLSDQYSVLGEDLFRALLVDEVAKGFEQLWDTVVDGRSEDGADFLRLRIEIDPQARRLLPLAGLPWELLERPNGLTRDRLGTHRRVTLVRYLETGRTLPEIHVDGPLRVLVVVPEPEGREVRDEEALIESLRDLAKHNPRVAEPQLLRNPTLNALRQTLRNGRFHVLHFLGHGRFDDDPGSGVLLMIDEEDGTAKEVGADVMANVCKGLPDLALVVLCACEGAALAPSPKNPFLSMAPALLDAQVPAVIGMQYSISHLAAIGMSIALYDSLGNFDPVDRALSEARLALTHIDSTSYEWPTPVLFTRIKDCQIVRPAPTFDLGIRSFRGGDALAAPWGQGMKERCKDNFLELSHHFMAPECRLIRSTEKTSEGLWPSTLYGEIGDFLRPIDQSLPIVFEFAAHNSLVFVAGRHLEDKSGLDLRVRQRGQAQRSPAQPAVDGPVNVPEIWSAGSGEVPDGDLWTLEEVIPRHTDTGGDLNLPDGRDLVVAVSVTEDVKHGVRTYLHKQQIPARRILFATLHRGVGQKSIKSGAHAWELALELAKEIRRRTMVEDTGMVHLFAAAPNALMLYLGQGSRMFGAIQLYEHHFGTGRAQAYLPSLRIVPEGWEEYQ